MTTPRPSLDAITAASASALLPRLRNGTVSAQACAEASLARIAARDADVRAWAYLDPEQAMARAGELDDARAAGLVGALHGVPIGLKDVLLTFDMPTQYNSPLYRGFNAGVDAACVSVLRSAGALLLGKTDTVEFGASGRVARTRNPLRLTHTPGGSSSGSAAAVADFHVPLAIGTQTGGSIVRPASYCGIYGMKPTWNLVSREGARMFSASLDTIGWFARSAADLALLFDVFEPEAGTDAALLRIDSVRIAICRSAAWHHAEAATRDAFELAVEAIRAAGGTVVDLEWPDAFARLGALQGIIMRSEGRSAFLAEYRLHGRALHESFRDQVENAGGTTRAQLRKAYDVAAQCRAAFDAIAGDFDAVLTPSTPGEAPRGLAATGSFAFNAMWSVLHAPCINVPGFLGPSGLPVGLTLVGPRFSDRRVLAAAAALGPLFAQAQASRAAAR